MINELIASLGYVLSAYYLLTNKKITKAVLVFLPVAIGTHFYHIYAGYALNSEGINSFAVMNVLSMVSLSMVLVGIFLLYKKDIISCSVVLLISAICIWFPLLFSNNNQASYAWGLKIHIAFSIFAYVSLGFASLYASFLIIRDYSLKKGKQIDDIPLTLCYIDKMMIKFTVVGTVLLLVSLLTGVMFIDSFWEQHLAHKTVFSIISLLIMSFVLLYHYKSGFRGKEAAVWLLAGFVFLVLAYFGSAIVLQIIL